MPLPQDYLDQLNQQSASQKPKRGDEMFEGTDYPQFWSHFVGQERAKAQLHVQIASANARKTRIEHTLLASGLHGVGKTTLATLLAYNAGVGITQTTGPLTPGDAREMISAMEDRDILFIDEAHQLTAGNRNRADWLLPFMTEGKFYTDRGAETMPDIAIVAATTDVGKLPQTLISRFMCQPQLVPYTPAEGASIAQNLAGRLKVTGLDGDAYAAIARAADCNPRAMRQILTQVRDLNIAYPERHPNLELAFEWAGVSPDGLSQTSREMLVLLLAATGYTASIESIKAQLGEPGPIAYHEQALLRRGLVEVTGRGRKLTDLGVTRAREELSLMASRS